MVCYPLWQHECCNSKGNTKFCQCDRCRQGLPGHHAYRRYARPFVRAFEENITTGCSCICCMRGAGGKSLCYALPALVTQRLVLVISPLIGKACSHARPVWPFKAAWRPMHACMYACHRRAVTAVECTHRCGMHTPLCCFLLAALMQDQAASFQRAGIRADYLCSTRSDAEREGIYRKLQGSRLGLHLLLVTPESFGTEQ